MGLIDLIIYLVIVGLIFYLVDWMIGQIPLPDPVRVVIRVLMVLVLVLILLQAVGVIGEIIAVPRLTR
jgi:hypothetical protein